MKKLLFLSLVAFSSPLFANTFSYEYNGSVINYEVIDAEAKTCQIARNTTVAGSVIIPSIVSDGATDFTVVKVQNNAFCNNQNLIEITLPQTISELEHHVFCRCNNLKSVSLPEHLKEIPECAFSECRSLVDIQLPTDLEVVHDWAFCGCDRLKSIIFPPSLTSIGARAFYCTGNLSKIAFGNKVNHFGTDLFLSSEPAEIYITSQTPPNVDAHLCEYHKSCCYVLGNEALDQFTECENDWCNFSNYKLMVAPTSVTVNYGDPIVGHNGEQIELTADFQPANVSLPYIFWRSTNPAVASVDRNGVVTIHQSQFDELLYDNVDIDNLECDIIGETLYGEGYDIRIPVNTGDSSKKIISENSATGDINTDLPYHIFQMNGNEVSSAKEDLSPGFYIIRQDNVSKKLTVI